MSLIRNIFDSYRAPRSIFEGFSNGQLEERSALGFLAGGCLLAFISTWPAFARMSYFTEQTLEMMLAGALFAWIFLAPLFFYILVGFITLILFFAGFQGIGLQLRLSFFWSFLASTPILLVNGLAIGFLGRGNLTTLVEMTWTAVLIWFFYCSLRTIRRTNA